MQLPSNCRGQIKRLTVCVLGVCVSMCLHMWPGDCFWLYLCNNAVQHLYVSVCCRYTLVFFLCVCDHVRAFMHILCVFLWLSLLSLCIAFVCVRACLHVRRPDNPTRKCAVASVTSEELKSQISVFQLNPALYHPTANPPPHTLYTEFTGHQIWIDAIICWHFLMETIWLERKRRGEHKRGQRTLWGPRWEGRGQ